MTVSEENNKPIFRVKTLDDIAKIPDEYVREFAIDTFKALLMQIEVVAPIGISFGGLNFQPNGLGDVDYQLVKNTNKENVC